MVKKLNVNENFFNEESNTMFYVLGAAFRCYTNNYGSNVFRSRHMDLVEIIHSSLECEQAIRADPRGKKSYVLEVHDKALRHSLERWGLAVDKSERKFPVFDAEYLRYFNRGFFDAVGTH